MDEIIGILREQDSFAVAQRVESDGSAAEIARRYQELLRNLYWKSRDLRAAISVGRLGVHYCLMQATQSADDAAKRLRGDAKQMAYDIGSFAWPGWAETGITIGEAEIHAGHDAAKLNLRLAIELQRPDKPMCNAYWLLGAHAIVDGRTADAIQNFAQAADYAGKAQDAAAAAMNRAYANLARLAATRGDAACERELHASIQVLDAMASEDSLAYAQQLRTAKGVFVPK